ncbi:YSIRK-type signal peptide-containing protein [Variovorax sp. Sphag1AA]|uniref:YSIRK-type signal peptide-containing protein n=1 Tax=Variovorax sp. Sphag1AA TaxID=2587027 RepID=UPI00161C1D18|nr:YSIRK-type signal peptide-containing protein [Variovorax sp. Sphag1AA]MBB3178449.1 hypothetical protein [Variovorax sp. Sphag1AA]
MKVKLSIGIASVLIGVTLVMTGERMCRTTCWLDSLFKMLLPPSLESWAGGMPAILVGLIVVWHAIYRHYRK